MLAWAACSITDWGRRLCLEDSAVFLAAHWRATGIAMPELPLRPLGRSDSRCNARFAWVAVRGD